jgi:serine/threonine-protein kinase RsbW
MVIASRLEAAREVEEALLRQVALRGYDEAAKFAIKLALEEALNNAIKHGNGFDAAKPIEVQFDVDARRVLITITDKGQGFDPDLVPDPTLDENLEKPCGRGIMLMRAYMDEIRFNEKGNQVHMIKRRK